MAQGCVISPDLFNLYCDAMLNNLETVPGFIIVGRKHKNIRYTYIKIDSPFGKKTTGPHIEVINEKREKWINHQVKEDIKYGDQQGKQPKIRNTN